MRLWLPDAPDEPLQELTAPGACVRTLAWSPDGVSLACVGGDGSVQLWEVRPGPTAVPTRLHGEWIRAVAWSPDGATLATGGDDGSVRLWDVRDGQGVRELGRHGPGVAAVAWLAGGRHVLSGDDDGALRLWDAEHRGHVAIGRHELGVRAVAGSPDGSLIASVGGDSCVRIWPVAPGAEGREPTCTLALTGTLHAVAWQPAGSVLTVAGVNGLHVLELVAGAASPGRCAKDDGG